MLNYCIKAFKCVTVFWVFFCVGCDINEESSQPAASMIIDYTVIKQSQYNQGKPSLIIKDVKAAMLEGWVLLGGVTFYKGYYSQAMVKYNR